MHGGAITLARQFRRLLDPPDLLLATDMLDLTTFLALNREQSPQLRAVLYMHENQLTYPLPDEPDSGPMRRQKGERDLHYAFVNYASMMAADAVVFNSKYHQRSYFEALPAFLKHFPEFQELESTAELQARSHILPVGIDLPPLEAAATAEGPNAPPLIIWNHRWEYDKNPADFFSALYTMDTEGIPFRLAVCGKNFRRSPAEFSEARERLAHRIIHFGYASKERYHQLLGQAAITVSTAFHEFFGISTLEAIHYRTFPILPDRLSYPELIPEHFHPWCLYQAADDLRQRLRWALTRKEDAQTMAAELAQSTRVFEWSRLAPSYDQLLSQIDFDGE
jgi:glycosyltransferase involved in cell wall biosynthesis